MAAPDRERYERERDAWIADLVAKAPPITVEQAALVRAALLDTLRTARTPRSSRTAA